MQWFLWAAGIAAVTVVLFLLILRHLRGPARPRTREERLAAARAAGKGLRHGAVRQPSRADRDPNADTRWSLFAGGDATPGTGGGDFSSGGGGGSDSGGGGSY
ncbi:hypothetical protein ACTI_56760 [Actinoplanes sp. OR16]|uniref:hypothetical protein n=1 Tax=Actinoplanes sp. OR16 TaxID=946334 RepID=UPI000F6FC2E0|nr:hypothetical protein [Actinoplanes sp. OR16]BBH68991.1 hypothetical protein ACTI_56760 [Actinoplanes sp. OR16]